MANQYQSPTMRMLSEFRSYFGASGFREIFHLLFLMVCAVIGTPSFVVGVAGFNRFNSKLPRVFKKKINSQRYSAKHTAKGSRTKKTGQSHYFIGYKKHTLRLWIRWNRRVLLVSAINIVKPANISDVMLMPYFLEQISQRVPFPIHAIVADKGYTDASIKEDARKELAVPIVTGVRYGMSPPDGHGEFGPECFYGVPLVWDQYDPQTHENLYLAKGDSPECRFCVHQSHCHQEIRIDAGLHEHYFGMIPLKSKTTRCLLQIVRPQVERGNELDKNHFGLKHYFLNSLEFAQILSHLADACQLPMILKSFKTKVKYIAKDALGNFKLSWNSDFDFLSENHLIR